MCAQQCSNALPSFRDRCIAKQRKFRRFRHATARAPD